MALSNLLQLISNICKPTLSVPPDQIKLNKRTLAFFKQRLEEGKTDIAFIRFELKRAEEEEEYERAIAIREALKELV